MPNANDIALRIKNVRAQVGKLSHEVIVNGADHNTGAIDDANTHANTAVAFLRDGDLVGADEVLVLAEECLGSAV